MTRSRSPLREAAVAGTEDRVAPAVPVLVGLAHRGLVDVDPETLDQVKVLRTVVDGRQRFG